MSSLTSIEKRLLEDSLQMSDGYVLDFTNREFSDAIKESSSCEIYADNYSCYGDAKAKRLRSFWEIENDTVTASALKHLFDYAEAFNLTEDAKIVKCRNIVSRLTGVEPPQTTPPTKDAFLSQDFPNIDFQRLPIEGPLLPIIEERWEEAKRCSSSEAYLSVVILLGSLLEAILLGAATANPKKFNQASAAPRRDGKVLQFPDWSLANFIDAAREIGLLNEDVKKFSHALRAFRNYIHPYEQMTSQFAPDKDTANISLQVFRAAANQIQNFRS